MHSYSPYSNGFMKHVKKLDNSQGNIQEVFIMLCQTVNDDSALWWREWASLRNQRVSCACARRFQASFSPKGLECSRLKLTNKSHYSSYLCCVTYFPNARWCHFFLASSAPMSFSATFKDRAGKSSSLLIQRESMWRQTLGTRPNPPVKKEP